MSEEEGPGGTSLLPQNPTLCCSTLPYGMFSWVPHPHLVPSGLYPGGCQYQSWKAAPGGVGQSAGWQPASDVVGCLAHTSQVLARWRDPMAPGYHRGGQDATAFQSLPLLFVFRNPVGMGPGFPGLPAGSQAWWRVLRWAPLGASCTEMLEMLAGSACVHLTKGWFQRALEPRIFSSPGESIRHTRSFGGWNFQVVILGGHGPYLALLC